MYLDEYKKWLDSTMLSENEKEELRSIANDEKEIENRLNNSNLESPFLNKQQACHYLGISNNTLDSWIKRGLPAIKIGKTIRFNKEAINSWLYSQN